MDVIFDFDFTLIPEESTVEVLKIALEEDPQREQIMQQLADIAPRTLIGKASAGEYLFMLKMARRVTRSHIDTYVERNKDRLLPAFRTLFEDLRRAGANILIISGGYEEWIKPIAAIWGIPPENVVGNRFLWWGNRVIGLRPSPLWSSKKSKTAIVGTLRRQNKITTPAMIVGDGSADRSVWHNGAVRWFVIAEYYNNDNLQDGDYCYRAATPEQMCKSVMQIVNQPEWEAQPELSRV
ncbi:HAD family hydrolase [Pantoea sp. A4]|uniref:HAD family hydrolase n=1 Tax=Pantoea sp. A4 TaxID=1225184 RepID=UPI0003655A12|nr:HAD-IB family phosphatase [Pantoea sp. A4]